MLQALLGPIGNIATTFLKNRAEKAKAKQKLAVAKIEAALAANIAEQKTPTILTGTPSSW